MKHNFSILNSNHTNKKVEEKTQLKTQDLRKNVYYPLAFKTSQNVMDSSKICLKKWQNVLD